MLARILLSLHLLVPTLVYATTDQSYDLKEVLEQGSLNKADCDRYFAGERERETTLRCGKYMFFFESFGQSGLPAGVVDSLLKNAPDTLGDGFRKWGFIANPYSKKNLPLGFTDGSNMLLGVKTYAQTCATCHFAQVPDGRYVVGQPNHYAEISRLLLAVNVMPEMALQARKKQPKEVEAALGPLKEEFFGMDWNELGLIVETLKLVPSAIANGTKPLTDEQKLALALNPSGVLDPFAASALEDGVPAPLRILPLWNIESYKGQLASNGGVPDFFHVFHTAFRVNDSLGAKDTELRYSDAHVVPLITYIQSLKAPKNQLPFESQRRAQGKQLFESACSSCHNGPGYAGTRLVSFEEIGTDPQAKFMMDKDGTGVSIGNVAEPYELTRALRIPRMEGVWSLSRFFHNGSLNSLEDVFCLNGPRPKPRTDKVLGFDTAGHEMTCENFTKQEKEDMIYFLESL